MNWHGDFWDNKDWLDEKKINFFLLKLSKFLAKRADKLRVVNPLIKRKLIKAGIDEKKIIVIPTPVNLEKFVGFNEEVFKSFTRLDDQDVLGAIKEWQFHEDKILATLSNKIINRNKRNKTKR